MNKQELESAMGGAGFSGCLLGLLIAMAFNMSVAGLLMTLIILGLGAPVGVAIANAKTR